MPVHVRWEGPFAPDHSLAIVNREIVARLRARAGLAISVCDEACEREDGAPGTDVCVRHEWPLDPHGPEAGRWVIVQPWEYGALPRLWYEPMRFGADEVWVPSTFNRECYVEAGIPAEKVRVVPNGVQEVMFAAPRAFPLRTRKRFKFLFVGGTIRRKGIDLLLDAYTRTFGPGDDVCLVVKDFGASSFYRGQGYGRVVRDLEGDPSRPEIEYIDRHLSPEELRDLYHACDCLVHPYRGEGFGLPIAEAMACGLPVIVPDQGGAADFCLEETAVRVPSRRVAVPPEFARDLNTLGYPWWLEVDSGELRARMRALYETPDSFRETARRGREWVRSRFSWDRAAEVAAGALQELAAQPGSPLRTDGSRQAEIRVRAGVESWERGAAPEALRHLSIARWSAETTDTLFNVGGVLAGIGDDRVAAQVLERAGERAGAEGGAALAASSYAMAAVCLARQGRAEDAAGALGRARSWGGEHEDVRAASRVVSEAASPGPPVRTAAPAVRWRAPLFNGSGYADEARTFILGLRELGWDAMSLEPIDEVRDRGVLEPEEFELLRALSGNAATCDVYVQHHPVDAAVAAGGRVSVLRTMFETDRIPPEWADACNRFSEVWVPTEFNRESFARSGVVEEKLRVVPGGIDLALYDPAKHRPLRLGTGGEFRFLSVFDWQHRKGWDVLLHAYFQEFGDAEDVTLVLKPGRMHVRSSPAEFIAAFRERHGYRRGAAIELVERRLTTREMISLYLACDAFVLPTRGEGWGRPYMEAMALGKPAIATGWGGQLAFMSDENSYLIEVEGMEPADGQGMEQFEGHLWARPSVESTRALMRSVYERREEACARGARGRADVVARFGRADVARTVAAELQRLVHG